MNYGDKRYIWQQGDWPNWNLDLPKVLQLLTQVSLAQGKLLGRLTDLGLGLRDRATLTVLTEDVVKTSEIEGIVLAVESVRSSLARRLGVDIGAIAPVDRRVEGVVEMVLDATSNSAKPLTQERLWGWHAALFPSGFSGRYRITVGQWRDDAHGPMQVVSGPMGRNKIHFEAPPAEALPLEIEKFLYWANEETGEPALVKAALAHLWFVTLHPFDDGNGRIARAIGDLFLARSDGSPQRFYSLSQQIKRERKGYYEVLERVQKGSLDVTAWVLWFLATLAHAIAGAEITLDATLIKARLWQHWAGTALNDRQVKMLNRLLDGFVGKLTSSKWGSMTKCSQDTALRDITQLLELGILKKSPSGGRSSSYEIVTPDQ